MNMFKKKEEAINKHPNIAINFELYFFRKPDININRIIEDINAIPGELISDRKLLNSVLQRPNKLDINGCKILECTQ